MAAESEFMGRPITIDGVLDICRPPEMLEQWPSADSKTRIVVIIRDLVRDDRRSCFNALWSDAAK